MALKLGLFPIMLSVLAMALGCGEALPTPTPEGPGLLSALRVEIPATVHALLPATPLPPTPEAPSILSTVRLLVAPTATAVPTATPQPTPTPEGPSIYATMERRLATPTATRTATPTPGPTATPYSSVTQTISVDWGTTKVVPLKLAAGARIEGMASVSERQSTFSVSIQNPLGQIDYDSTKTQATNFLFVAPSSGNYSLLFRNGLNPECSDLKQCIPPAVSITYSYQLYGS